MSTTTAKAAPTSNLLGPEDLDAEHFATLGRAVRNLLATEAAEITYGEIVDGLPTKSSFEDFHYVWKIRDHPSLQHESICEGAIDTVRTFRDAFDPSVLRYNPHVSTIAVLSRLQV